MLPLQLSRRGDSTKKPQGGATQSIFEVVDDIMSGLALGASQEAPYGVSKSPDVLARKRLKYLRGLALLEATPFHPDGKAKQEP